MPLRLLIGNKNYSSWSLRPWLAMKATGIAFEEALIPLNSPDFRTRVSALSGGEVRGSVPVLIDGEVRCGKRWRSLNTWPKSFQRPAYGRSRLLPARMRARSRPRCIQVFSRCAVTYR